jgi:phosphate uptake regulator
MIVEDLPRAAQALLDAPGETAGVLAERERVIDALYLEVESLASREVLLQAPVAANLRFLLSVLRVTRSWSAPTTWSCRSPTGSASPQI